VDLALAFHQAGDAAMLARLATTDLAAMKMRQRIATALRFRLEASGARELVRRASALFALPGHGADGARAIWGTADAIWRALGDTDTDLNWYSKRASLGAVYGAAVLYWLGDDSPDQSATRDFIDRRIDNVMQVEKLKARLRENPLAKAVLAGPLGFLSRIRAPQHRDDLPGSLTPRQP
ncbi:MAG: ubiquinone biosynthesis protein, partial [Rhodobacteraceae bacterium CG2_30_10_405]